MTDYTNRLFCTNSIDFYNNLLTEQNISYHHSSWYILFSLKTMVIELVFFNNVNGDEFFVFIKISIYIFRSRIWNSKIIDITRRIRRYFLNFSTHNHRTTYRQRLIDYHNHHRRRIIDQWTIISFHHYFRHYSPKQWAANVM